MDKRSKFSFLIAPIFNFLLISSLINGIIIMPYILQLSYGKNWIPILLILCNYDIPILIHICKSLWSYQGGALLMMIQFVIMILNPIIIKIF